jgi:polyisoprenoid-binding protein YceI
MTMDRTIRLFAPLSLIASLAMFGASGCANPADDVTPAAVSPPPSNTATPGDSAPHGAGPSGTVPPASDVAPVEVPKDALTLEIAPGASKVEFIGSKVTGKHEGHFNTFTGTWQLAPGKPEASRITAEIDMDSTVSDNDQLTTHLKSPDFFDVAKFPKSTFETTSIVAETGPKGETHLVTGNLTLHGVTKSIQFPAKISTTPDSATLDSEFFIKREEFDIKFPGKADDLIRSEVVIKLDIHAAKKG